MPSMATSEPATVPTFNLSGLPQDLGKCIEHDVALLQKLGWRRFVATKRYRKDLTEMQFDHPARRLLLTYKKRGVPAKVTTSPWSPTRVHQALRRGAHRSCRDHTEFLAREFVEMIQKNQWTILPFSVVQNFQDLRLSPPGVVPQHDRRPRWIVDYSFYGINDETLPLVAEEAMQFGQALHRILRHILLADPRHGPVYIIKLDISDGFYRIDVNPDDIPRLGVVFPTSASQEPLVAFPLVLPMGWKNSPPAFCAATETSADLANAALKRTTLRPKMHPLDELAAEGDKIGVRHVARQESFRITRDPSLPSQATPLAEVDVYVDDFIAVAQGSHPRLREVRSTLLHAIDQVFRPNDNQDAVTRAEPVLLKKLRKGDGSWNTKHTVLGWEVDTVAQTIALPPHRQARLREILDSITPQQRRIGVTKWHQVLGELRSMSIALPGSRGLFSFLQEALRQCKGTRVSITKQVHQALDDFRWIVGNLCDRPTRIAEIVPLLPSCLGHHDASGSGAGGVWFPAQGLVPRGFEQQQPLLWRFQWPEKIARQLITDTNPHGTITISDLELAGGLLHLDVLSNAYDVRERTVLSKTDNLATLFWQRKGSTTSDKVPPHLLRLFGIHQRIHRYVPRHDYIPGGSNPLADDASRLFHLDDCRFLTHFNTVHTQPLSFQLATPSPSLLSAVISALLRKRYSAESLLDEAPAPTPTGAPGANTQLNWASIPFSKPAKIRYQSYKSSSSEYDKAHLRRNAIPSSLERLKITYGALGKRSSCWATRIHA